MKGMVYTGVLLLIATGSVCFADIEVSRVHDAAGGSLSNITYSGISAICQGQAIGIGTNTSYKNYAGFLHQMEKTAPLSNEWFGVTVGPHGNVTGDPEGLYTYGSSVTVTAVPKANHNCTGWLGDIPGGQQDNKP